MARSTHCTAPEVNRKSSGTACHSACHPPVARSCSWTPAPRITGTVPMAIREQASAVVASTGLRLCGMADERPLRSEEHTSELQSHSDFVCRLQLEKKDYSARPARRRER